MSQIHAFQSQLFNKISLLSLQQRRLKALEEDPKKQIEEQARNVVEETDDEKDDLEEDIVVTHL